jgi:hypothetical protein
MIELLCSYNSDYHGNFVAELMNLLLNYPEIKTTFQDGKYSDTRKKAFQIKNKFGATIDPFVGIKIDDAFKKGFYSEANQCNINNIKEYLDGIY